MTTPLNEPWLPEPDERSAPFFEAAGRGELKLQRCETCQAWHWPVRRRCSECGGTRIVWSAATGRGRIYSHGQLRRAYHPRHAERLPLCLAVIDLDEGVRIVSNLVPDERMAVRTGAAVVVDFETFADGGTIPVFKLA